MIKDYLRIATASLKRRGLRTLLTTTGVFIGIAAIVALISLGQGLRAAVNEQFASVGFDKIIIQGASANFGPPGQDAAGTVSEDDLKIVKRTPGVSRAAGRILQSARIESRDELEVLFVASVPEESDARKLVIDANNIKLAKGRMLSAGERGAVIAGNDLWQGSTFEKPLQLGNKILINGKKFKIVGLLEKIGAGRDNSLMINEKDARELFNKSKEYSAIFAETTRGASPSKVADKVMRALRRERGQKEGFEDFTVQTSEELIASINTVLGVIQAVFVGIALISLLVGGIGIMNTMYTSVLERQKDIGIMKSIGARRADIIALFVLESGFLGLAGGIVGSALGTGLAKLAEILGQNVIGGAIRAHISAELIAFALAFGFSVGMISGILPARDASKLAPVEALRK
ncbi:ABC transporter permease [Candidatus Woesearchaeota archaeon]|nr:MAG: ABC transporter permease [Candidatus Woesearchaeota archaeon]